MSDSAPPPTESAEPAARPVRRYARERRAVGVVFFAITGAVIVNGAAEIWRETYRPATVAAPFPRCSDGIRALYDEYAARLTTAVRTPHGFAPNHPTSDPTHELARLDEALLAMRPICIGEGRDAHVAYDALTLWRYQAQDVAGLEERILTSDAERALNYQSPGTHR